MAVDRIKWTKRQLKAIETGSTEALVTASAGTGKTAVLSQRCLRFIAEPKLCPDVSNILVLTFTDAAAQEMKTRIAQNLRDKIDVEANAHLRRQLLLLDAADISTIHSFCKRTITKYFYRLGINPAFRIIEPDERKLIQSEILTKIIAQAWGEEPLQEGLRLLLNRRNLKDDRGNFLEIIITIAEFLDGVYDRAGWCQKAVSMAEAQNWRVGSLAEKQKQIIIEKLDTSAAQLRYARIIDEKLSDGHWSEQINEYLAEVTRAKEAILKGHLDKCAEIITKFEKDKWKNKPKDFDDEIKELIQTPAKSAIKQFKALADLAIAGSRYDELVAAGVSLQTKILIELVKRFDAQYAKTKAALNCLDFADLEHKMLELLTDDEMAAQLSSQYQHIFVDEYQDINVVQQKILEKLSADGNMFIVGDIKQSIYAWRQAEPAIFIERLNSASGAKLELNENFRSRRGILDFVNTLFRRIMIPAAAMIDYDENAELKSLADISKTTSARADVELHIIDEQIDDDDDDSTEAMVLQSSSVQRQAVMIAGRIKKMVENAELDIFDKTTQTYRPIQYGDIVILMRSPGHKANDYVRILGQEQIPVTSSGSSGYFETTEITDCISLLKVLDNPQRDIELAGVLRSPFFNFNDTDLVKITTSGQGDEQKKINFYNRLKHYGQTGGNETLRQKANQCLEQIEKWRTRARSESLADLLWRIFRHNNYLTFMTALPDGKQRRANLLKLHARAIQFEGFASSAQTISLSRFVGFIEKLLAQNSDWAPAEPGSASQNVVRIMSVHKSKGLEFPVVFIAETNKKFNTKDISKDCLTSPELAMGLTIIEPDSKTKLKSLGHQVIAEQIKKTTLAEEMRILYVAMTRASQKLILTGSEKTNKCRQIIMQSAIAGQTIADWQISTSRNFLEWILSALADQKKLNDTFETHLDCQQNDSFELYLHKAGELEKLYNENKKRRRGEKAETPNSGKAARTLPQLVNNLLWEYPFDADTKLPAKKSVSELTHSGDEFGETKYHQPILLSGQITAETDAKLVGLATHLLIQKLDLSKPVNSEIIRILADELIDVGVITARVAKKINYSSIEKFFHSELGSAVVDANNEVFREWPFTFAVKTDESEEKMIVQGIIDMLIKTPAGIIVVDFKTDRITADQVPMRAQDYKAQIDFYSSAASAILKNKIISSQLYFLAPAIAIEC